MQLQPTENIFENNNSLGGERHPPGL